MPKRGEVSQFEGGVWGRFDGVDERGEEIWSEVSEEEALSAAVNKKSPLNMDALSYQSPQERRASRNATEDATGKWNGGDRLRDVAVDTLAGVGRGASSMLGGVMDLATKVNPFGGTMPGLQDQQDKNVVDVLRTKAPNTFDAQLGANPESGMYNVAEGATRAAPYIGAGMTVGGAGAGNMLFNAIRGNSGALMSATKYFLSKGLEGAALDAAVAAAVGDPVLPTAAVGGLGTMAGMPFFDRAGLVDAVTKGNVRSSLAAGAEAIGSKGAIDEVYDDATGQTDTFVADMVRRGVTAQQNLAADYSEVAKIRLSVGQERGAIALVQVQRTLENDVDAGKYFVEINAKNADALEGGLNHFANRVSGTDPLSAIEGLAKTTREAKEAYISAYHEDWNDVAKVLGMVDAAGNGDAKLLRAMPISTDGMVALQNMRKSLVREFDGVPGLESSLAYIDDQIAAISSGTRNIEQVNNASRHFFDADAAVHIPNKAIRQRVRKGLNDAMYDTVAQLGAAKAGNEAAGTKLADQWLAGRTKVAKSLDKWESDAIAKIQRSVGKTSAANTAKLIAANPEWADDVISFIEGAGQSPEQAKRFIARGFVENAISGARTAPGSGGFDFDPAKFVSSLKASRETQGMVLDQKLMDDLDKFAQLSSSMSTPTGGLPIEGQLSEAQLSATTQIQGKNVEQSNQAAGATFASNAVSPSSTLYGAVAGWTNKRINNYFSQNAISRITMDREAMAMLLTDDSLRQRLIQDMGTAVDDVRRGKVPLMDAKFQVLVKNRIATTDPKLYRRLYGAPAKVGFAGAAVPMFGGSDY